MGGSPGGGSSGGTTTTVQKSEPWSGQKPFLEKGFEQAESRILNNTPEFFPQSTVVPFSPETEVALQAASNRAILGSPLDAAAQNSAMGTLQGDYLSGGDAFNQSVDAALRGTERRVLPYIHSAFNRAGRGGSGLAQEAVASAMADTIGEKYAENFASERENQMRSLLVAPQLAQQDYSDIGKLAEVGAARENLSAENLADQVARHNFGESIEGQQVADYMNIVQGNYGQSGFSETSQRPRSSGLSSGLGAGLMGLGLLSSFFSPGGGGLLGAFF